MTRTSPSSLTAAEREGKDRDRTCSQHDQGDAAERNGAHCGKIMLLRHSRSCWTQGMDGMQLWRYIGCVTLPDRSSGRSMLLMLLPAVSVRRVTMIKGMVRATRRLCMSLSGK